MLVFSIAALSITAQSQQPPAELARALSFHASFDHGVDADFGRGNRTLQQAPSLAKRAEAKAGLPSEVQLASGVGRFGNALRFTSKKSPLVFFESDRNFPYRTNDWSGTVSFWLSTDPESELEMGYCDPIQITPRAWNDAAFFVEFEKRTNNIPFRIGVYPDFAVWNPDNKKWEEVTSKPLVDSRLSPFAKGRWTHVVFTFDKFNTGRNDGTVGLYIDGEPAATIGPRRQTFTWGQNESWIMLGVGYLGLWDELAIFDRALAPTEVHQLYTLPKGVSALHK